MGEGLPWDWTDAVLTLVFLAGYVGMLVVVLLAERRDPSATLAWVLTILFLPYLGGLLYLVIGKTRFGRRTEASALSRRRIDALLESRGLTGGDGSSRGPVDARTSNLLRLARGLGAIEATSGNTLDLLVDGAATFTSIREAIVAARHHVHVEFYIIQPDEVGEGLRDILVEKAKQGVEVRVLCDALGSNALPADFWRPLAEAGGQACLFQTVSKLIARFSRSGRIDFRNHRKIVVVDGAVGFTGGLNIGREYLGRDPRVGRWRDSHVRIEGPAAIALQKAFAEDWDLATDELLDDERYYPSPPDGRDGGCVVQIIESGPDDTWSPILHFYEQCIAEAQERIWITSPYFVPPTSLKNKLISAALRRVDVRLLLPRRSDSHVVNLAARSYYQRLLDAGVRIWHFDDGFIHAKTMVVDDWVASIGSANLDLRSFNLNFELNAFAMGGAVPGLLAQQFLSDLESSHELPSDFDARRNLLARLCSAVARLLSPLL